MAKSDKLELTFVEPMECLLVSRLPEGPEWTYEIKLDGYRAQALCAGKATQLLSRNGKELAGRFPSILRELSAAFPADSIVDGELVALDPLYARFDADNLPDLDCLSSTRPSGSRLAWRCTPSGMNPSFSITRRLA